MRCRMRCGDIWRCGGPIKKYVPVDSIGIEGRTQEMTFDSQVPPYSVTYSISISPSDATKKDVRIESNNPSIISVDSVESDQVTFTIHNEGDARVRITSLADADISDEYSVSVVTPSEQFAPNNGIFVDVDTEGTATGRKRKTKATAIGDRFTARVFMLNEDNPNYVLLEWTHGGDVSKTYVGAANEAHTRAMFTEETTDKLAREIETLWDDGQIANGFVKFTDNDWTEIQEYYATDLTPESVAELQAELMDNAIVREPEQNCFTSMFFGYNITPVSEVNVGKNGIYSASWRGLPDDQHIVDPIVYEIGDESIATITNYTAHPADEQNSEWYSGDILGVNMGQTTITFYSVNNPRETKTAIPVTVTPPESYYYISLHEAGEIDIEAGNTYTCYAEVEDYKVNDTLAASGYDDSIISVSLQKRSQSHGDWRSDWNINITGLQAGETTARIHSVNNPEVYEDIHVVVFAPAPVESIGAPSVNSIEEQQTTSTSVTFEYSPTLATDMSDILFNSTNENVAAVRNVRYNNGVCTFSVLGVGIGSCTISYSLGNTTYSISVTVTEATAITLFEGPSGTIIRYPGSGDIVLTYTGGEALNLMTRQTPTITIADKNLGATRCYDYETDGETIDVEYCGLLYQYGNNHGFGYQDIPEEDIGNNLPEYDDGGVAYSPMNPYSSEKFCKTGWHDNVALRMRGTSADYIDNRQSAQTVTYEEWLRGPCPSGYHLGGEGEYYDLFTILQAIFAELPVGWNRYLLMPGTPRISWNAKYQDGQYYASTGGQRMSQNNRRAALTYAGAIKGEYLDYGCAIRPFKNFGLLPPVVSSIGAPSENSISLDSGNEQAVTFSYYPANAQDAGSAISVTTSDENVANINSVDFSNGIGSILIYGADEGNATVSYTFGQTTYTISVAVTADPPAPSSCPASLVSVWGDDSTISIGETTAVVTNFTTSADCANVDYSNIVATSSSNIVTTNVDINDRKVYVTGVSTGQCTITFSDGDNSWTFNVTVQAPAVQSIEDFDDAYVLYGETMNVYVDILPLDASYSTADFNLTFTDGGGNVVQNPPVTADVVSIINVEGHVAGIGIEVIGGQTAGDVYMTVEYTPSQGAISGGGWIHVGPAATALSDIMPLQIRVGELGSYRVGGLTPSDALTKGITVTSSDDSVVSVGLLYNDLGSLMADLEGLSAGEATLTITLTNGAEYEKTVTVVDRWQTVVETMHGGIYHNAEDGIYYLTDATGTNQLVIADKNLNATGLWDPNDWDDSGTYGTWGGKYQWGNNYDFNLEHTTSHEQVDASAHGPSNPYNVNVLITPENQGNYYFWDSSSNTNLWGYDDYDTSYQSGTPDVSVMKGPCPEGWHIPLKEEWNQLLQLWSYIRTGSTTAPADTTLMSSDLLLPTYDDGWGLLRANFLNVGETTKPVGFVRGVPAAGLYPFEEDTYNIRPFINELPEDLPEWNASGNTCYAELQYVADEISLETPYQVSSTIQYDGCENVDPTNITTSSDDENIAVAEMRFDTNGATLIIRSVAPGTCTVTTTDGNNSFTTAVTVTAPTPPTYATISSGSQNVTMAPGDTVTKRISFSPSNADTSNITWTNSDSNVANGSQQLLLEGMCDTAIDANSEGTCTVTVSDGTNSYVYNVTVVGSESESHTFTINVENAPEGAYFDDNEEQLEDFPIILDIPSGGSFNGFCESHEENGTLSVIIYDTPDGSSEGVVSDVNVSCVGYKPLFGATGFNLEDVGDGAYNFKKDDNYQIAPDSDVSMTISFTPIEEPESHTFTINVENLPEGADISGEITDPETGETLEEISASSFPMAIDFWTINIDGNSHEGDGDISIMSLKKEGADKNYQINIVCDGYKPLFEAVGFDFNDAGDGSYSGVIEAINLDSNVSLTISFTPVE